METFKSHLCGPPPTNVATKASRWSSAYPCSYNNTMLVLSGFIMPKSPLLWSSAYPCRQQRGLVVLSLPCIMCILSLPKFPQKATCVVLSQPYSLHFSSSGPQSTHVAITTPVATKASCWALIVTITALYVASAYPRGHKKPA